MSVPPAIVLAAGEGIRLRPLTKYRPKPMLPAVNTPILQRVLDELIDIGVSEITLVVGYRRDRIQSYFGPTYRGIDLQYRGQEPQLGTGHALLAAEPPDEPYLLVNGDQIIDHQLIEDVIEAHTASVLTLGVLPGRDVSDYGGAIVRDGEVVDLVDRPTDERDYYLNAGVYCCEPQLTEAVDALEPQDGERSLVDGIGSVIESDASVNAAVSSGFWADANYPWDLLRIAECLLRDGDPSNAGIAETATVDPTAIVREPVAIAPNCEIGPGAVIGPYTALGENVTVEPNAVVGGSVLDADTRVGANATVIDTVTGVRTTIGPGTAIPGGEGDVRVGNRVFTDRRLGAVLADRVFDRGGTTYQPGTIVGPDVEIAPGAIVRGEIEEGTFLGG